VYSRQQRCAHTRDARTVDYTSGKPTSKAHANDLIQLLPAHDFLPENHPQSKGQQQHAVPKVTKHDSEEEGEGDNGEGGWVGLPVLGHTIRVHNLLEGVGDLVGLEVCGWLLVCHQGLEDGAHL
jgi:hypothetical protein